jgi:UDP-N-acetyl-D-glucosamine dehydrogenase
MTLDSDPGPLLSSNAAKLRQRFESRDAVVAVIGQGYVGLPLAAEVVEAGFRCVGVDIDPERVAMLQRGESYIFDVADERLKAMVDSGRYEATTDFSRVQDADAISICVPTPLRKTRDPDLSYIQSAVEGVRPHLKSPSLVILESTTYPGTTEEIVAPLLVGDDRVLNEDLFVAFSPERVDPGNETHGLRNTPKVVGGASPASTELIAAFYDQIVDEVHPVPTAREAELVKLLENTFRAVNIALVNEMAVMCDRMGIDIWRVIEAAATKPFGFMPFYPGPGIGGHCIPLDPTYLSWKAKSYGFHHRFIELATDINGAMPRFVVRKLVRLLNARGTAMKDARILLVGMAYKPNINDLRESPALDIWKLLGSEWGADLQYHDPFIPTVDQLRSSSVDLTPELLDAMDAVIITANHNDVDYALIAEHAPLVLDARNAYADTAPDHIVRL